MDTEMTSSLNSKYSLYMIKTTHLSDEPFFFEHEYNEDIIKQRITRIERIILDAFFLILFGLSGFSAAKIHEIRMKFP